MNHSISHIFEDRQQSKYPNNYRKFNLDEIPTKGKQNNFSINLCTDHSYKTSPMKELEIDLDAS
jgi:hypothetical protein